MLDPGTMLQLAQFAPALVSAFTQNKKTPAEKQQEALLAQQQAAMAQQADLVRQSSDPNSALYKQQYGIETGNVARDYAQSIEELVRNQRRNNNMGRTGLLDNERADEVLSRLTDQGVVQANQTGRQAAQNDILKMADQTGAVASGYGNLASSYGGMVGGQATRNQNNSSILSSLTQAGVDAITKRAQASQSQGRTIADIYRDMNAGTGGQNPANQSYNQDAQMAVPRLNTGGWYA